MPIQAEAFALLKASAGMAQAAAEPESDQDALWKAFDKIARALRKLERTLHRAEM